MLVIRTEVLKALIKSTYATGSPTSPASTVNLNDLPKELQLAISVYYEFWHNRPKGTNRPKKEEIKAFLLKTSCDLSVQGIKRIDTIAKPEEDRVGGAPSQEQKNYKGKSKEN